MVLSGNTLCSLEWTQPLQKFHFMPFHLDSHKAKVIVLVWHQADHSAFLLRLDALIVVRAPVLVGYSHASDYGRLAMLSTAVYRQKDETVSCEVTRAICPTKEDKRGGATFSLAMIGNHHIYSWLSRVDKCGC